MTLGRNWFSNRKNKDNKDIIWTTRLLYLRKRLLYRHTHNSQTSNYVPKWIINQFIERSWEWKQDNGFVKGNIYGYLWSNGFKYNR